ncbi:sulfite exporter TauE/SafE family protein [Gayadomonas joobiniege]|uniref:sulfite exporter TauE/SafE family protein n=1 Tax=Gayadomonas joobiniege TaxID=1234606 RepID=UPI0003706F45|nr:sulfite exporter TauE/SafE family protein [Gayadomonas joobiniege]
MNELLQAWPIFAGLAATGVFAGILAGLFGVGGGIVIVPVLYFLLQQFNVSPESAMQIATATSLATIIPTSVSSIRAHQKKGNIHGALLKLWGPIIILFAVLGSFAASQISGHSLTLMFAVIALLVSLNMLFRSGAPALFNQLPGRFLQRIMAAAVGGLSVMIGIGGGTIGVPLLTSFNVAAHKAVGTAAVFGLLIAVPGTLVMLLTGIAPADAPFGNWGLISLPAFLILMPLTILFAPIGANIGSRLNSAQLKKGFAVLLVITGIRMIFEVLG